MDESNDPRALTAATVLLLVTLGLALPACKDDFRVGELVWVTWEGRDYPAYVIEQRSRARYRVHYDGYDSRWDEDVTPDCIKGRIRGPVTPPPAPEKVARAMGMGPSPSGSTGAPSVFTVGDRVRVRWRGSIYPATIVALRGPGQVMVHYDGYGTEWDEAVLDDRVVGKR